MPLEALSDTRRFEEIFEQARLRIPRYTPEWRDWNDSDPGITLLQLFSWLTELQLYELNRSRIAATSSSCSSSGWSCGRPSLRRRTSRSPRARTHRRRECLNGRASGRRRQTAVPPLIFETEKAVSLARLPLTDVQVYDSGAFTAVTAANDAPAPPTACSGVAAGRQRPVPRVLPDQPADPEPFFPDEWRLRVFLPARRSPA